MSAVFTVVSLLVIFFVSVAFGSWQKRRKVALTPPITPDEFEAFQQRLAKATLPVVWITLQPAQDPAPTGSRIGGRPYIDGTHRKWPVRGADKVPMLFLGQINFAEVPPLDGFPRQGLLQVFVLANARGDIEATDRKTDRVIRWFPDPAGALTLDPPESLSRLKKRGTFSPGVIRDGLTMNFEPGEMDANPDNWPYTESYPNLNQRLAESDELRQQIKLWERSNEALYEAQDGRSWIGGHPQFVQEDVRREPRLRKLNRVLLHLASDTDDICLGDAGELNLMISHADLRATEFDKAHCTWDCS